jgi:hypothetical protein
VFMHAFHVSIAASGADPLRSRPSLKDITYISSFVRHQLSHRGEQESKKQMNE